MSRSRCTWPAEEMEMEDVSLLRLPLLPQPGEGELPQSVVLAALLPGVPQAEGSVLLASVHRVGPVASTLGLASLNLL